MSARKTKRPRSRHAVERTRTAQSVRSIFHFRPLETTTREREDATTDVLLDGRVPLPKTAWSIRGLQTPLEAVPHFPALDASSSGQDHRRQRAGGRRHERKKLLMSTRDECALDVRIHGKASSKHEARGLLVFNRRRFLVAGRTKHVRRNAQPEPLTSFGVCRHYDVSNARNGNCDDAAGAFFHFLVTHDGGISN